MQGNTGRDRRCEVVRRSGGGRLGGTKRALRSRTTDITDARKVTDIHRGRADGESSTERTPTGSERTAVRRTCAVSNAPMHKAFAEVRGAHNAACVRVELPREGERARERRGHLPHFGARALGEHDVARDARRVGRAGDNTDLREVGGEGGSVRGVREEEQGRDHERPGEAKQKFRTAEGDTKKTRRTSTRSASRHSCKQCVASATSRSSCSALPSRRARLSAK